MAKETNDRSAQVEEGCVHHLRTIATTDRAANGDSSQTARLVYIASDVRSGSTLLDLLLSGHESVTSVGELQFLKSHYRREGTGYSWDWVCTCGLHLDRCSFWRRVNQRLEPVLGRNLGEVETWVREEPPWFPFLLLPRGWIRRLAQRSWRVRRTIEVAETCWRVVDEVVLQTGRRLVVDSSKNAEQLRAMYLVRPQNLYVIHLVRDGRGVTYSKMQRADDSTVRAARKWVVENVKIALCLAPVPRGRRYLLRYEALCRNPTDELSKLFQWLGLADREVHLSKEGRHNICGSPHRFDRSEVRIQLDQRWRTGLSSGARVVFAMVGGWLNAILYGFRDRYASRGETR